MLLEGVILLDTMNLSPSINKTTKQDEEMVHFLQQQHSLISQDDLFTRLQNAKYDPVFWSSISLQDALEYDFKVFQQGNCVIGWSAVLTSLASIMKENESEILSTFCKKKSLDGLILSSVVLEKNNNSIRREFAMKLSPTTSRLNDACIQKLKETLCKNYQCQYQNEQETILYTYTNISRKALAPVLMKLLESIVC